MRHSKPLSGAVVVLVLALVAGACGTSAPPPAAAPASAGPAATVPTTAPVESEATAPTQPAPTATITTTTTTTTTTITTPIAPPAITVPPSTPLDPAPTAAAAPPSLNVLDPQAGATVGARLYLFRGTTDPGCTVRAAGRYDAEVDDSGNWAILLVLNPGGNVAVFEATDPQGATTEVRLPVYHDPLLLRADGLGEVDFRTPMDDALATFVDLLGLPDWDDVVTPESLAALYGEDGVGMFTAVGYPANEYFRSVVWEEIGLQMMFSDYVDYETEDAAPNFNGWIATGRGLVTAAGQGVGSSRSELEEAYGGSFTWYRQQDELTGDWHFTIDSGLPGWWPDETLHLYGRFAADPSDPATNLVQIQAGFAFDEC